MTNKILFVCMVVAAFIFLTAWSCYAQDKHSYKPKSGYVPNEATAVLVAEAILRPIYSDKVVEDEKPFHAELSDGIWTVTGTLHCPGSERCLGGVGVVEISKDDGKIVRVSHGK